VFHAQEWSETATGEEEEEEVEEEDVEVAWI